MRAKSTKSAAPASRAAKPALLSSEALIPIVSRELQTAGTPLTASAAHKLLKTAGHPTTASAVADALEHLVEEGQAYRHLAPTAKSGQAYSRQSLQNLVIARLNEKLKSGTEHTLTELRGAFPKAYADLVDEALGGLLRDGKLFEKPGSGKTRKFTTQRIVPTSVLTAPQRKSLETILGRVNALRPLPLKLSDLLAFLDSTPVPSGTNSATAHTRPPTLAWLEDLYRLDLPSRGGLTSMPIPSTWRRYVAAVQAEGGTPDRTGFERVLLEGSAHGRIEITPHEWPAMLSPEDLAVAINSGDGRILYYWRPMEKR